MHFETLLQALDENRSEERFIGFINGQDQEKIISFESLAKRALGLLYILQDRGIKAGDYLILFLNDNEQMIDVFWACQYGGIIPVPLAVGISDQHRQKVFNVAEKLQNVYLYTDRKNLIKLASTAQNTVENSIYKKISKNVILTDDVTDISTPGKVADVKSEDISFIQFSSGSTGSPKGVVLKHRNLLANIEGIKIGASFTTNDISLSWMPLTHDMGLIGFHLNPVVCNYSHYIMRTDLFVRRPLFWLTAASEKKANVLCSPNFGYKHFLKAYARKGLNDIDLSHIRLVFNGAEPISVELCQQFTKEMNKFGLPEASMFPVYGLAEASLAVSFPQVNAVLHSESATRQSLTICQKADLNSDDEQGVTLVSVGSPIKHCSVRISDQDGNELPEGTIGHIHISGKNVTEEIIGDDGAIFYDGGWLDTGDLGFIASNELFITGRYKEILFVNGQNYYPYDIEESLYEIEGLELGKVVVAGVSAKQSNLEEIIVFILHKGELESFKSIASIAKTKINELFGIEVHQVIPIKKVPKTTSGKVQRSVLADEYLDGNFSTILQQLDSINKSTETLQNDMQSDEIIRSIYQVCKEALPDKTFNMDDSLLEVGASSLALVEIHSGLEELYPGIIDITDLVEHPTISDLARYLREKDPLIV